MDRISERTWPLGGYAPGNYLCKCLDCGEQFQGDKRAYQCLPCAAWAEHDRRAEARQAPTDYSNLLSVITDIRERSGVGSKPMLSELADAIAERIAEPKVGDEIQFCPQCGTLHEVEAAAPGYPIVHDFEPDLEGFYRDWLGKPLEPLNKGG